MWIRYNPSSKLYEVNVTEPPVDIPANWSTLDLSGQPAGNADTLDTKHASDFLLANGVAVDSDKLDSKHASEFALLDSTPIFTGGIRERSRSTPQGEWVTRAFSGSNFTGNGTNTWTVEAGDIYCERYSLIGRTCFVNLFVITSSVGGTPSTQLLYAAPFTAISHAGGTCVIYDNGTLKPGLWTVAASTNLFYFQIADGSNFAASTNTTQVRASFFFEI